ncbi:hypothetical protein RJ45_25455 [Photobacterium gaetbulicola]|uniref:Uncharacterized protein n=1 Tax=Photobacterium gaetbulicola TaxID=1295392 RepID=A0A0B9GH23_9GAMM|nr:hypothetical protein RJ45_25455 [Photobacterium gaetbulicola]
MSEEELEELDDEAKTPNAGTTKTNANNSFFILYLTSVYSGIIAYTISVANKKMCDIRKFMHIRVNFSLQ